MTADTVQAGGITIELSHTGKVLFPDDSITKGDLIAHYQRAAEVMLPWLRDRPAALRRYPDGITAQGIFQKNVPRYFPDWITRAEVRKQGGSLQQVICDKPATIVYLANQACIEFHAFLSRLDRIDDPDQLIFDLDPPDADRFGDVRSTALLLRDLLEGELGLATFLKTTGGKGLHVHVPLRPEADFDTVRGFARDVATRLASRFPDELTVEPRKEQRGHRLYLDIMRNAYAQTVVAPYSVRGRPGAHVSTPLHWSEVEDATLNPGQFTMRTIVAELERRGDPWAGMASRRHRLPEVKA